MSERDYAFVEAIVVYMVHKQLRGEWADGQEVRMCNVFLARIAEGRHPTMKWAYTQIERVKRKFVSRPMDMKPATDVVLLTEVEKGQRSKDGAPGTPSIYNPSPLLVELVNSAIQHGPSDGAESQSDASVAKAS